MEKIELRFFGGPGGFIKKLQEQNPPLSPQHTAEFLRIYFDRFGHLLDLKGVSTLFEEIRDLENLA